MKRSISIILTLVMLLAALSVAALPASAEASEGWAGIGAEYGVNYKAPAGSGERNDPYLISSPEELYWISRKVGTGGASEENIAFAGKYFEQTADIDLNGKTFRSIGYYFNGSLTVAFAGNYNGNGYVIKNGTITNVNTTHGENANWATGLFGVIYGATIENVVLENIHVSDTNTVGALVGSTALKSGDVGLARNVIRNCVVKEGCTVTGTSTKDNKNPYNGTNMQRLGGIVGLAYHADIENCINGATVKNSNGRSVATMGGIAGQISGVTNVKNCVNTGNFEIDFTNCAGFDPNTHHINGGIVGLASSLGFANQGLDRGVVSGACEITNCYNDGNVVALATGYTTEAPLKLRTAANAGTSSNQRHMLCFGGVLGQSKNVMSTVTVSNCYNLNGTPDFGPVVLKNGNNGEDVVGIIGSVNTAQESGKGVATVAKNCYSVQMTHGLKVSTEGDWPRSNECAWTAWGGEGAANPALTMTDVCTKTADEIKVYTDAIDAQIVKNQINGRNSAEYVGVQRSVLDETPAKLRFIAGIEDLDVTAVGLEIATVSGSESELTRLTSEVVYTSLLARTGDGAEHETVTAESRGVGYFALFTLNAGETSETVDKVIPADCTLTVRFYTENAAGVRVYGSEAKTFNVVGGVLQIEG